MALFSDQCVQTGIVGIGWIQAGFGVASEKDMGAGYDDGRKEKN